jgi:hypothetical protein
MNATKKPKTEPITISSYYGAATIGTRGKVIDGVLLLTESRARSLGYALGLIAGDALRAFGADGRRLDIHIA